MSDYVASLRALIGTRQLLLPSVAVLVWDELGRLLMVSDAQTGLWQTVGGSVEPAEDPAEAAVREAREETGLQVALTGIRGVVGGPAFQHTYPNGDQVAFVSTVYDARTLGGELLRDGDGDETCAARFWEPAALTGAAMTDFTLELLIRVGALPLS